MPANFQRLSRTNSVREAQKHYYEASEPQADPATAPDELTREEIDFIRARDSFYMATINADGWPYIQHRGGKPGFLRVISPAQLAFADYKGNRQLLSTGNLAASDRVSLFLMDYPQQTRLKILGHARVEDAREHPELVQQVADVELRPIVERLFFIDVVSFDWNCPQYITPRYTAAEVETAIAPLKERIAELEAQLKAKP